VVKIHAGGGLVKNFIVICGGFALARFEIAHVVRHLLI
jgi:hypothetical protein